MSSCLIKRINGGCASSPLCPTFLSYPRLTPPMNKQASLSQGGVIHIGEYTCEVKVDATISLSMVRVFQGGESVALQEVNFHDIVGVSNLVLRTLVTYYCEREQTRIRNKTNEVVDP